MFRPEAAEEFEKVFCRALEKSFSAGRQKIEAYRTDGNALRVFVDVQQLFGDVFICAGYFLGHLDGLGLDMQRHAPQACALLEKHPEIADLFCRLRQTLRELWLTEYGWRSTEVLSPIYDIICAMMALHGFTLTRTQKEWRIISCRSG